METDGTKKRFRVLVDSLPKLVHRGPGSGIHAHPVSEPGGMDLKEEPGSASPFPLGPFKDDPHEGAKR